MKYCWESFFFQMNHYLNDLDRILPRINEDLCGSKRKRGDPVKLLAYFHSGKVSKQYKQEPINKCIARKLFFCFLGSNDELRFIGCISTWANDHFSVIFKTISGGSSTTESSLRGKLDYMW